jgi:hypothetical protein
MSAGKHRAGLDRHRFNRHGDVVPDYRTDQPKASSPARAAFKQARAERRANATPAAAARAIHAAAQKLAGAIVPDNDMRGDQ